MPLVRWPAAGFFVLFGFIFRLQSAQRSVKKTRSSISEASLGGKKRKPRNVTLVTRHFVFVPVGFCHVWVVGDTLKRSYQHQSGDQMASNGAWWEGGGGSEGGGGGGGDGRLNAAALTHAFLRCECDDLCILWVIFVPSWMELIATEIEHLENVKGFFCVCVFYSTGGVKLLLYVVEFQRTKHLRFHCFFGKKIFQINFPSRWKRQFTEGVWPSQVRVTCLSRRL